ncbi:MAG: hypothetical protein IPJ07_04225 [Acidobacteria bacterium]|nr:hypothetical protein [Acidobacteriota bacterium]
MDLQRTSPTTLIGIKDRKYLDRATGLQLHRGATNIMRYAALNQNYRTNWRALTASFLAGKDFKTLPDLSNADRRSTVTSNCMRWRSVLLYSLKPPPNPNKFDALAQRRDEGFQSCRLAPGCHHAPPAPTNNKLTPVDGFRVPRTQRNTTSCPLSAPDPRLA